jgi:hypothetical protein
VTLGLHMPIGSTGALACNSPQAFASATTKKTKVGGASRATLTLPHRNPRLARLIGEVLRDAGAGKSDHADRRRVRIWSLRLNGAAFLWRFQSGSWRTAGDIWHPRRSARVPVWRRCRGRSRIDPFSDGRCIMRVLRRAGRGRGKASSRGRVGVIPNSRYPPRHAG